MNCYFITFRPLLNIDILVMLQFSNWLNNASPLRDFSVLTETCGSALTCHLNMAQSGLVATFADEFSAVDDDPIFTP